MPQVVDAVGDRVPVVAAGGLFDGRGLAAALALGADGAWIGTRFIATYEARAVAGYKETLLATAEDGTVVSRAYTGKTCRVVRNDWTQRFDDHPEDLKPFPQQAVFSAQEGVNHLGWPDGTEVDVRQEFYPCGQGVGAIGELEHAGDLVTRMNSATAGSGGGPEVTSGDTRSSRAAGRPIQASAPIGPVSSSATKPPSVRPSGSTRRTSSPASQPNVTAW